MQLYFEEAPTTEAEAHVSRSEELARRLALRSRVTPSRFIEACHDLDAAVEFAALEGVSSGEALREFLAETSLELPEQVRPHWGRLPVEPRTVLRLLRTAADSVSARELEDIAWLDPVLAGRLLGTANSALFASRYQITRLSESILRLGVPESRRVLIMACVAGLFASKSLQDLWSHSEAVARQAHDVAQLTGVNVETAWVAGLLHDIGRVVMATGSSRRHASEERWVAAGFPLAYAEVLTCGEDHAEVGAHVLTQWDVSSEIVEAVALHHRPECSDSKLVATICLAEDLAAIRFGSPYEDLWPTMRRTIACERAGITVDQFATLTTQSEIRRSA